MMINSHNTGWQLLRSVLAADSPALGTDTMDGMPSFAQPIGADNIKGIELILAGIGDENGTVTTKVWIGKRNAGPARLATILTWTLGTMAVNKDPQTQEDTDLELYADSVSVTSYWPTDIKAPNSGNNMLCVVSLDGLDYDWMAVEVTEMTDVDRADVFLGYFS
jgi:hypothetical protein